MKRWGQSLTILSQLSNNKTEYPYLGFKVRRRRKVISAVSMLKVKRSEQFIGLNRTKAAIGENGVWKIIEQTSPTHSPLFHRDGIINGVCY